MTSEKNGFADKNKVNGTANIFRQSNFSSVLVDGLLDEQVERYNNNQSSTRAPNYSASHQTSHVDRVEGLPRRIPHEFCTASVTEKRQGDTNSASQKEAYFNSSCFADKGNGNETNSDAKSSSFTTSFSETCFNFVSCNGSDLGRNETLITSCQHHNQQSYLETQSTSSETSLSSCWSGGTDFVSGSTSPKSGYLSSWEASASDQQGTSLESTASSWTVSFLTEIEARPRELFSVGESRGCDLSKVESNDTSSLSLTSKMETSDVDSVEKINPEPTVEVLGVEEKKEGNGGEDLTSERKPEPEEIKEEEEEEGKEDEDIEGDRGEGEECGDGEGEQGFEGEDDDDDDTTTLSSEAVVDDIELILMPEMCQDMSSANLSPKLVRVTELKLNVDDVFCDDDETDDDQSGRHEFRSIVDEVCEEEEGVVAQRGTLGRPSFGDDDVSSGSELVASGRRTGGAAYGESSKSSSSGGGRRRRSTSGRINSGAQTDITAVEEPTPLSSHGFRKKSSGKSAAARLGVPGGSTNGKKLNWKSELTLLPSKMKVKQSGFNSFESNDERDQYSPRVAKFTSQVNYSYNRILVGIVK